MTDQSDTRTGATPPAQPREYLPATVDLELAWRWIEALERGDYAQTIQRLRSGDRFCCLGVVCDIADPTAWTGTLRTQLWQSEELILPATLSDRLGISQTGMRDDRLPWPIDGDSDTLTDINDGGADFITIAALLRDYYGFPPRDEAAS